MDEDSFFVRQYVSIVSDGEAVAFLCGVIELGTLPKKIQNTSYGEESV